MTEQNNNDMVKTLKLTALATDPIYIGTGGYTIGRVDNTIVRDPITRLPKIPGSSLAGTWRYYMALELQSWLKDKLNGKFNELKNKYNGKVETDEEIKEEEKNKFKLGDLPENLSERVLTFSEISKLIYKNDTNYFYLTENDKKNEEKAKEKRNRFKKVKELLFKAFKDVIGSDNQNWKKFEGNAYSSIKCAGQDDAPRLEYEEAHKDLGHCGHCIVCKSFGFSKKDISWQGMLFFSDLEILLFPVFTRLGTRWITTKEIILKALDIKEKNIFKFEDVDNKEVKDFQLSSVFVSKKLCGEKTLNLGWLNLNVAGCWRFIKEENKKKFETLLAKFGIELSDIILVHEDLFSQIVNSNLEVRTSVSIDPLTGAAKESALFTSEAIPRGTVFTGEIRVFEKDAFGMTDNKIGDLPNYNLIKQALEDSKHYYESLGIGGMTTRGFGRLKVHLQEVNN